MRILFLTQWFDPEPTSEGLQLTRDLQARGHEVTVLTASSDGCAGARDPRSRVRPLRRETVDGVEVVRVGHHRSPDRSSPERAAGHLPFAASAALSVLIARRPEVVYACDTAAAVGLSALVGKVLRGVPFVYDAHELPPGTPRATGCPPGGSHVAGAAWWTERVCRAAARVVVRSDGCRETIASRGTPRGKIDVVPGAADEARPRFDPPHLQPLEEFPIATPHVEAVLQAAALSRPWPDGARRSMDVLGAAVGLTIGSPVMAATALAIRMRTRGPALFRQQRPGRYGEPFTMLKFRTMSEERDEAGQLLPDRERLTRLGGFLRRTSLDELPELWNVLKGDMALVGPRPLLPRYTPFFTAEERQRFLVRPGMTGLAQVNGRNAASWDDRLRLDVEYVRTRSVLADLAILARTVRTAVRGSGVVVDPTSTMADLDEERRDRWHATASDAS